tara:strand:+ start:869 stop:1033 length:165 start_codon:yes stop_codon:yes gene_type:complete
MIKFIKTKHHFDNLEAHQDGMAVEIQTTGQTLGEVVDAFNKFLIACGYQVEDEE